MLRLILLFVLALPSLSLAQSMRAPRLHVLDNGLRLLTVEDRSNPIVTSTWSAHVGDSAEPSDFAGNSHYLEHLLLFRGTQKFPKNSIGEWVAGRGGYFNGHTWYDWTTFEITAPASDLDAALERHEDMMFHAAFSGEDFETEKKAVFEELRRGLDTPYGYLWRAAPYKMYPSETFYSRSTIGTIETVQAATVRRVRRYYKDYYVPNNMTLALVGDFDTDEAVARVERRFGSYKSKPAPEALYEPVGMKPGITVVAEEREVGKAYFLLTLEGPRAESPEYFPYVLLTGYLNDGKTALLRDELVAQRKLLGNVSASSLPRRFANGWQGIDGEGDPEKSVDAIAAVWELLSRVKREGVPASTLDLARQRLVNAHRFLLDDQYQVSRELVQADAHGDYRLFSEYEERLGQVSAADVQAVARKYFTPDHFFLMAIFPPGTVPDDFENKVRVAAQKHAQDASPVASLRLDSGATLLHEALPGGAIESFTVAVQAGDRDGSRAGLAQSVARMMARQTQRHDKTELQNELDRAGLRLSSWMSADAAFFSLQGPSGGTQRAANLLTEILTQTAFSRDEWAATKNELLSDLRYNLDQPATVAYSAMTETSFRGTPYGRSIQDKIEAIENMSASDLRDFWKSRYRAGSLAIAYVGNATPEVVAQALAGLDKLKGEAPKRQRVTHTPLDGMLRTAKPIEGKTQANLYLAWPAPALASADWIVWQLAERALGGDLAGRLWKLRQDEGLAYSVWFGSANFKDQPLTHIYMGTAAEKRDKALAAIHREIRRALEGISAAELERVKVSYLASIDRFDRTAVRRAQRLATWWSQGLSAGRRDRLRRVVQVTSVEDVNRVVRSVLDPDSYYFAEAGAVPE